MTTATTATAKSTTAANANSNNNSNKQEDEAEEEEEEEELFRRELRASKARVKTSSVLANLLGQRVEPGWRQ